MTPEVVITGDGSSTVFHSGTGEHYHSVFGAITESGHVFINNGLRLAGPAIDPLNVLEVGFGTGLNALLTLLDTDKQQRSVRYDAVEPFPLPPETIRCLNYPAILGGTGIQEIFDRIHLVLPGAIVPITNHFLLRKFPSRLEDMVLPANTYHLVYFDAFSPNVQPELWKPEIFRRLFASMHSEGMLLTFCAKGLVARNMKEAGFLVEKIGGPPGKRHMIRARADAIGSMLSSV